jgi:predicted DNA binding protein
MSIVAEFTIESDEFLLGQLLAEFPALSIEIERVVPMGNRIMPYVWAYGDDLTEFETAMQENPGVAVFTVLDKLDDSALYKIEWNGDTERLVSSIADAPATILEIRGEDDWTFRIRFDDHAGLSAFHETCVEKGIQYTLNRVYSVHDQREPDENYGLTQVQYETLLRAVEEGYFEVPRGVKIADLADEFDVSEQAISERLRRGADKVLRDALLESSPVEP